MEIEKDHLQKMNILPNITKTPKVTPKFTLVVVEPAFPGPPACPGVVGPTPGAEAGASEPLNLRTALEFKLAGVKG
ncbi:hypothetical protein DY000_02051219 [Brassica cretica]|uniref:Uncharacterized protein n=1 Tax=Brassica cretica TaxID=69181 RepID=A0ABQ7F464_BRACR|nr:hypothetical protein DY000_02051219 [Brassica cretica]